MVTGIQTDPKYAGASGVGFTTEEYEDFLKNTLNGKDVLEYGQAVYFTKLFNCMNEKFMSNGKVDFSGPEFAALAEFVKNNVNENARSWDEYDSSYAVGSVILKGDMSYEDNQNAVFSQCYGFTTYFTNIYSVKGGKALLGLPSSDGRGPMIDPYVSVAISSQSVNVDACGEFVKMLLSDECMLELAMSDDFVLSRSAFRQAGEKAVEFFNGEGYEMYFGYGMYGESSSSNSKISFSSEYIDAMENAILNCSRMNANDSDIEIILIEEMPAYFSGQKDLEDVITIVQDRAQKVINERG